MRLPLAIDIESRDGSSTKDARATNMLVESDADSKIAAVRPGLTNSATSSGNGNGLVCYQGYLISIYGTNVQLGSALTTLGTVVNGAFDFAQSPT